MGLRVPFCWQIKPAGGGQTACAPSTQLGVHVAAAEVVVAGRRDGMQIEGVTVTVTVDAEQVFVAQVEVADVLVDFSVVQDELVDLGDDDDVDHVVADDLTELLCEVVFEEDVDKVVVLGTLIVVFPNDQSDYST